MSDTDRPTTSLELRDMWLNQVLWDTGAFDLLSNKQILALEKAVASHQEALIARIRWEVIGIDELVDGGSDAAIRYDFTTENRNKLRAKQRQALNTIANELKGESRG